MFFDKFEILLQHFTNLTVQFLIYQCIFLNRNVRWFKQIEKRVNCNFFQYLRQYGTILTIPTIHSSNYNSTKRKSIYDTNVMLGDHINTKSIS
jgi:hypothetical protein